MNCNKTIYQRPEDWKVICDVAKARGTSPSKAIRTVFRDIHKMMLENGVIKNKGGK